jgi:anti-sigma factor RsiW
MNRQDPFSEELLSAYLDGELSGDQQREVEQSLAASPERRQLLDDLRSLRNQLGHLSRYRLGDDFADRVLGEVRRRSGMPTGDAPLQGFSEELLSAYLDNEASEEERRQTEAWLAASPDHQQLFRELKKLHSGLQNLPGYHLDAGFAQRVMQVAVDRSRDVSAEPDPHPIAAAAAQAKPTGKRSGLRARVAGGVLAVCAVVLLVLQLTPVLQEQRRSEFEVAQPNPPPTLTESEKPVAPNESLANQPPTLAPDEVKPPKKAPVDALGSEPWQFVATLAPSLQQKLLLVYELSVTPEGVADAAFANLLKRQNFQLRQTVAVEPEDQTSLLKRQFLQNVQLGRGDRPDADEVNLFLVSCTARDAEAVYFDIMSRPPGFASFQLNLTSKDGGPDADDGAVRRLCEANKKPSEAAEVVQLLVNFAVLSRTARQTGAFGILRVEPSLLKPGPQPSSEGRQNPAAQIDPSPQDRDDFRCEVLFVVRNLKPLPSEKPNADR